ncbi:hypothetical protein BCR33DRAFT_846642 [Rhizoclosmatium globosum]|uniref:Uncharacterized protein n=1 Tax=Rhizoclosmatium globosum TaxID=329046 RepID=A0A1Y2CV99_9FUNG|nr:hypothetical protein BCR33DRAFT_846642 [Rhizoclosmatium globosum]|eukprot:ORY50989.1 hypothetical protein BCR33DRAFT_846642 [Rhizoclosmatium globosum]
MARTELDAFDLATPRDLSAFLAGAQITSSITYALVFGITSFIIIFGAAYGFKLFQLFYYRQGSEGWNYRLPRELGSFVAACQLTSLISFATLFTTVSLWGGDDFPADARKWVLYAVGGVFGATYLLRGLVQGTMLTKKKAASKDVKKDN